MMNRTLTGVVAGLLGLAFGTTAFGQFGPATPPPMPQSPSEPMQRLEQDRMKERPVQTEKKKKRAAKRSEKAKER